MKGREQRKDISEVPREQTGGKSGDRRSAEPIRELVGEESKKSKSIEDAVGDSYGWETKDEEE